MNFLGSRKKVLSRWMTPQAERKRNEARREMPDSYNNCGGKQRVAKALSAEAAPQIWLTEADCCSP